MKGDYLWDKSGEPDPEIRRLEQRLTPLGYKRPAGGFAHNLRPMPHRRGVLWRALGAVAAVVLVATTALLLTIRPGASWAVATTQGSPRIGSTLLARSGRLGIGEWLITDSASRARIEVGRIGQVHVEPDTRLTLVTSKTTEHRLRLERGTIHAFITAPPRLFFVDTPSAVAVDLGCAYTLEVDDSGAGLLRVIVGWVGFEWQGRESFIPAGAACRTRSGEGPGTPYYTDASEKLQTAVVEYDRNRDPASLAVILAEARKRDGVTLWHLLGRTQGADQARVLDRLSALIPAPEGVTRDGVLAGDRRMLDKWWAALGLGDTLWWRLWKGKWQVK